MAQEEKLPWQPLEITSVGMSALKVMDIIGASIECGALIVAVLLKSLDKAQQLKKENEPKLPMR